jgi:hypothetical protein
MRLVLKSFGEAGLQNRLCPYPFFRLKTEQSLLPIQF